MSNVSNYIKAENGVFDPTVIKRVYVKTGKEPDKPESRDVTIINNRQREHLLYDYKKTPTAPPDRLIRGFSTSGYGGTIDVSQHGSNAIICQGYVIYLNTTGVSSIESSFDMMTYDKIVLKSVYLPRWGYPVSNPEAFLDELELNVELQNITANFQPLAPTISKELSRAFGNAYRGSRFPTWRGIALLFSQIFAPLSDFPDSRFFYNFVSEQYAEHFPYGGIVATIWPHDSAYRGLRIPFASIDEYRTAVDLRARFGATNYNIPQQYNVSSVLISNRQNEFLTKKHQKIPVKPSTITQININDKIIVQNYPFFYSERLMYSRNKIYLEKKYLYDYISIPYCIISFLNNHQNPELTEARFTWFPVESYFNRDGLRLYDCRMYVNKEHAANFTTTNLESVKFALIFSSLNSPGETSTSMLPYGGIGGNVILIHSDINGHFTTARAFNPYPYTNPAYSIRSVIFTSLEEYQSAIRLSVSSEEGASL
jgi:hypothetical protein